MTHKTSILIVEDEKNICDFISATLSSQGYKTTVVHNGADALSVATSQCPDLILLDLGLPDMDGVDVIAFTAGLGENGKSMRKAVCEHLSYLGIKIDDEANSVRGKDIVISTPDSKVKVMVIPTNEELAIARETLALVK